MRMGQYLPPFFGRSLPAYRLRASKIVTVGVQDPRASCDLLAPGRIPRMHR